MIERNLTPLVLVAAVAALVAPELAARLEPAVGPLLALLLCCVSLTFDLATLARVLRRPGVQLLATVLVYGPMSVAAFVLANLVFDPGALWLGFVLVGTLPTDVSSPLLVLLARGNVALATVLNAVNTLLAPLLVPALLLAYTGIDLEVSLLGLVVELAIVVVVPTVVGVLARTWRPTWIRPREALLSATASTCYLLLVVAVVGPNAQSLTARPVGLLVLVGAAVALHAVGYGIGSLAWPLVSDPADRTALLFTTSKKEFSIAALLVFSAGLPAEAALPAVVYAVVQMVSSPLVANRLARHRATPATPR